MAVSAAAAAALSFLAVLLLARAVVGLAVWVQQRKRRTVRTLVVLGSGGHTAEMLSLLKGFDLSIYTPRCYVVAATDAMSAQKVAAFESAAAAAAVAAAANDLGAEIPSPPSPRGARGPPRRTPRKQLQQKAAEQATAAVAAGGLAVKGKHAQHAQQQAQQQAYEIRVIPRSREVGQSFTSSIGTTLRALRFAVWVALEQRPDLLLVNGPGTCIPVCAAVLLMRLLGLARGRVVYVESIARVYRLSLSGKILYHLRLADRFLVQWVELQQKHPRAVYAGRLM